MNDKLRVGYSKKYEKNFNNIYKKDKKMKKKFSISTNSGIGFTGLLAIVFIVFKLLGITDVAEWSWVWVLAPVWIPIVMVIFMFVIMAIVYIFLT